MSIEMLLFFFWWCLRIRFYILTGFHGLHVLMVQYYKHKTDITPGIAGGERVKAYALKQRSVVPDFQALLPDIALHRSYRMPFSSWAKRVWTSSRFL